MKKVVIFSVIVVVIFLMISVVQGSDMQTAIRSSDKKLKANGFFLEEIEDIWQSETTPNVLEKLIQTQQKTIDAELKQAQSVAAENSLEFGKNIKGSLEQSLYQEGVRKDKVLKSTRENAKKYGIKLGDVLAVLNYLFLQNFK